MIDHPMDLSDEEFLNYCERISTTERAEVTREQIIRLSKICGLLTPVSLQGGFVYSGRWMGDAVREYRKPHTEVPTPPKEEDFKDVDFPNQFAGFAASNTLEVRQQVLVVLLKMLGAGDKLIIVPVDDVDNEVSNLIMSVQKINGRSYFVFDIS